MGLNDFIEMSFLCMGTIITQRVYGDNASSAASMVKDEFIRLENRLSFFRPESDVSRINNLAGKKFVLVGEDAFEIIRRSLEYSRLTSGLFDITAGPLIKGYGIMTDKARVLSREEINKALKLINYKDILIDDGNRSVKLKRAGQMIDLGAIAKGYAADRAIEIYKECGIKSALVNLGGNVKILGKKADGTLWNIGIQDPDKPTGKYAAVIQVEDRTVVTSGDYERFFKSGGKKYHHIMDIRTGEPSQSDLKSATLVCRSSIEADALSTACFVMGLKKSLKFLKKLRDIEGIFITKQGKITATPGLYGILQII